MLVAQPDLQTVDARLSCVAAGLIAPGVRSVSGRPIVRRDALGEDSPVVAAELGSAAPPEVSQRRPRARPPTITTATSAAIARRRGVIALGAYLTVSGVTWAALPFVIQAHGSSPDLAIQFLTADTGSILFDERTFTTRTGWGHWSEYPEPRFGPMTYLDDRHWVMGLPDALAGTVRIAETTDAGRTWTTHTRPIPKTTNLSVSFVSAMTWIATIETTSGPPTNKVGPAETWTSQDAGRTWTFIGKLPTSDTWRSRFVDPSHAWVPTGAGGLATTNDGGATWSVILRRPGRHRNGTGQAALSSRPVAECVAVRLSRPLRARGHPDLALSPEPRHDGNIAIPRLRSVYADPPARSGIHTVDPTLGGTRFESRRRTRR